MNDGRSKLLIPGLADMHVHINQALMDLKLRRKRGAKLSTLSNVWCRR